jgi:hypothetical protein
VRSDGIRVIGRRLAPPLASTGLIVAMTELAASYDGVMVVDGGNGLADLLQAIAGAAPSGDPSKL